MVLRPLVAIAVAALVASVPAADGAALTMKRARAAALKEERAAARREARRGFPGYPGNWQVAGSTVGPCRRVSGVIVDCTAHSSLNYFGDLPSEPSPGAKGMRCRERLRVTLHAGRTHVRALSSSCRLT